MAATKYELITAADPMQLAVMLNILVAANPRMEIGPQGSMVLCEGGQYALLLRIFAAHKTSIAEDDIRRTIEEEGAEEE